jgi:hypothetical protein
VANFVKTKRLISTCVTLLFDKPMKTQSQFEKIVSSTWNLEFPESWILNILVCPISTNAHANSLMNVHVSISLSQ